MKREVYSLIIIVVTFFFFNFGCQKQANVLPTLNQFINSLPEEEALQVQNLSVYDLKIFNAYKEENSLPVKIKFTWDCNYQPIGLCVIIPIGKKDSNYNDNGAIFADLAVLNDSIVVISNVKNHIGFTSDNYFPLKDDYIIDTDISKNLGYKTIILKAGIYKVFYNSDTKSYNIPVYAESKK